MKREKMGLSYSSSALSNLLKIVLPKNSKFIDFRGDLPTPENLSRMLSGMANTEGGIIVIGVDRPDVFVGVNERLFDRHVEAAKSLVHGLIDVSCSTYLVEQKIVGVLKIKASEIPVSTTKGYFKRVGDEYVLLDASQLFAKFVSAPDHAAAISSLSETISSQSGQFEKLRESFEKSNSWKRKVFYILVGAVISAITKWAMPGVLDSIYHIVLVRV